MGNRVIRCGVVQFAPKINAVEENLRKAASAIHACVSNKCNLVVFPEAFATSLELPRLKKLSEPIPGPVTHFLSKQAADNALFIVAGVAETAGDKIYSSSVLIDNKGELLDIYRRVHIYDLEDRFIYPGNAFRVAETGIGRIGMIIGYDINFPESCRMLFHHRVEIIICPSQIPDTFSKAIRCMAMARATENCCYFVFASSAGMNTLAGLTFMGNSMILRSPLGLSPYSLTYQNEAERLAEAGGGEAIIYADLDMTKLRREQRENPLYGDSLQLHYERKDVTYE